MEGSIMTTTNKFMEFKIVCNMREAALKGQSFQDWSFHNQKYVISLAKATNLWEKAVKGKNNSNWQHYLLHMAEKFTKEFVMEMNRLEQEGADSEKLTEKIKNTLSECWDA